MLSRPGGRGRCCLVEGLLHADSGLFPGTFLSLSFSLQGSWKEGTAARFPGEELRDHHLQTGSPCLQGIPVAPSPPPPPSCFCRKKRNHSSIKATLPLTLCLCSWGSPVCRSTPQSFPPTAHLKSPGKSYLALRARPKASLSGGPAQPPAPSSEPETGTFL